MAIADTARCGSCCRQAPPVASSSAAALAAVVNLSACGQRQNTGGGFGRQRPRLYPVQICPWYRAVARARKGGGGSGGRVRGLIEPATVYQDCCLNVRERLCSARGAYVAAMDGTDSVRLICACVHSGH